MSVNNRPQSDDLAELPPEAAAVGPRGDQATVGDDDGISPSSHAPWRPKVSHDHRWACSKFK